ncbi:MAG: type II secretion system protein [Patescibacteria group bacterium]
MINFPAHNIRSKKGFTLIELLVVTGISAILLLTITSLFATFLMSNVRTQARRQLQSEGNGAIRQIEFLVRNASTVTCADTEMTITTMQGDTIDVTNTSNRLQVGGNYITSDEVTISSLDFECTGTSPLIVEVNFQAQITAQNLQDDNQLKQDFSSRTLVRNTAF